MNTRNLSLLACAAAILACGAGCKSDNGSNPPASTTSADPNVQTPVVTAPTVAPATNASADVTSMADGEKAIPDTMSGLKPVGTIKKTLSGLEYQDYIIGKGKQPAPGQTAVVDYTGILTTGQKFDSSRDRGQTFSFPVGAAQVIKGWDEGVLTMHVGGRRRLIIPSDLGYGDSGDPPKIPPSAVLVFDIELKSIQ